MPNISKIIRKGFGKSDRKRDKGLTTPDDIMRYDDIAYGSEPYFQLLDVYRPKGTVGKKLPVIMIVHGGGWVYGDKGVYQFYGMSLAQKGFAVVNFTYRLAPEFKFPAGIVDVNTVAKWIMDNQERYDFDVDHIYAVGDSAGGQMLADYATIVSNPKFASYFPFDVPEGFSFKAVGLNCGVYTLDADPETNKLDNALITGELLANHGTPEEIMMLNPIPFMTKDFPPAYIMTAKGDVVVKPDQADALVARLEELGVDYVRKEYGDDENPLYHVFHCNMREPEGAVCNEAECAFFLTKQ